MKLYYKYFLFIFVLAFTIEAAAQTTIWRDIHKVKKKKPSLALPKTMVSAYKSYLTQIQK